ncbi:MAG: stage 0 sporulation protein [Armatimonadia bacterium]|nr:stage 0 sporulation protein [Armatimonadia bacterium]
MSDADRGRINGATEVGVRFRHNPKIYSFVAEDMRLSIGDRVLVRSEKGVDMGEVMELRGRVDEERAEQLMPVVRKATEDDLEHLEEQERREKQALKICAEKIEEHGLPMKLIDSSLSFDNTRLVFYFSADGRVDFRELVRDLAKTFRLRIELRQIGVRDEAKLLGGLGPCGRRLCCKTFMRDFEPVGIRVAKDQGLALNPNKISGLCDRLMCCLLFEHETYCTLRDELPSRGDRVMSEQGPGTVRDVMLLKEQVEVHLDDGTEIKVKVCDLRPLREKPQDQRGERDGGDRGRSERDQPEQRRGSRDDSRSPDRKSSGRGSSGEQERPDGSRTREKKDRSDGGGSSNRGKRPSRSRGRRRPRSKRGRGRPDGGNDGGNN